MARPGQRKKSPETLARLEARVVQVPEATIRKKWRKLPTANHSAIRELILSAEERSRQRKGRNGIDLAIEASVKMVVNRLTDKLTRMPYPAGTEEQYFDFEVNLHRINRIEEQLSSNTHAMKLLSAQLAKEEELLKQDESEATYLEESLRSNEVIRRQQSRTLHPMARQLLDHSNNGHCGDMIVSEDREGMPSLQILLDDQDMLPILEQLQSHLESMHNNSKSIAEVQSTVEETSLSLKTSSFVQQGFALTEISPERNSVCDQT